MKAILRYVGLSCFFSCVVMVCFSQDKASVNFTLRVGAGSNIATQHFFTNDVYFNLPTTSYVHIGLSSNIIERGYNSLFLGIDLQAVYYYPVPMVKTNLAFFSLLIGKTRNHYINEWLHLKQTHGISLNTLAEATSSNVTTNPDFLEYTGNPFRNLNIGAFTNLQVLFAGARKKNRNVDYGLSLDFAYKGYQIYKDNPYPSYLYKNLFLQYGININICYNF